MNPGSGFGSGFGQQQQQTSSMFGTSPGFGSPAASTASGFGTTAGSTSFGSGSQVFGSGNSTSPSFGTMGGAGFSTNTSSVAGFGSSQGFGSGGTGSGNTGFGQSPSSIFGTSGSNPQGFNTSVSSSTSGFGAGNVMGGFGSGSSAMPGFGAAPSGFGAGAVSSSSTGSTSTGPQFRPVFSSSSTSNMGASVFSTASTVFGTSSGTSGSSMSAFGTGGGGFGTGGGGFGTGGGGFGTGGGGSAGFGTSTAGFNAGTTGFGTGSSGFGTGSSGMGTGSSGFGVGASGSGGSSVFGTSSAGLGTSTTGFSTGTGSGFSSGSSVFGTSTGKTNVSFTQPTTQTASVFGGSSVFGTKPEGTGTTAAGSLSTSGQTGTSVFGHKPGSVFGQTAGTAQGFGGGASSVFSQGPASTTINSAMPSSSVFGVGAISSSSSGFGSATGTAPVGATTMSTSAASNVFGGTQATSVFGAPQMTTGTPQNVSSISGNVFSQSRVPASSSSGLVSTGGQSSIFGGGTSSTKVSSSIFGGVSSPSQPKASVFGGAGRVVKQETSQAQTSRPSDSKAMLFPAAAAGSAFGIKPESQSSETGSAKSFTGIQGAHSRPVVGQPSASVFGGSSSVFGGARQPKQTTSNTGQSSSVFGGRQGTDAQGSSSSQRSIFPAAATITAERQASDLAESSGIHAAERQSDGKGAVRAEASSGFRQASHDKEGQGSRTLQSGRILGVRATAEATAGASTSTSSRASVFGGKRETSSAVATAASVFGGRREPGSSFTFPTAPGGPSGNQKRSAADKEDVREAKRGRAEEEEQQSDTERQDQLSGSRNSPAKGKLRRASSVLEDITSKTSIVCKRIPPNLNKGSYLRRHFSRFGRVKRVTPVPAKRHATIKFETHEDAVRAKEHGTKLPDEDRHLSIYWKSSTTEKSPSATKEVTQSGEGQWTGAAQTAAQTGIGERSQLQKFSLPSSVAAELASMGGADSDASDTQYQGVERRTTRKAAPREGRSTHRGESSQRCRSKTPPASASRVASSIMGSPGKQTKGDVVSVSSLHKMIATTTMEKVNVLDTRDKLIRQKTSKHSSIGVHAKAFVGNCPDMCPEKERLYREETRRLSVYEIIPGSSTLTGSTSLVDHTRAVMEYSRSSADQDEPLPHELRPLPVLTMTMNYLLTEIADLGEDGKWAEWYDFLWNRTRSIRKEITQQQLLSVEVVELLEKCVRFHIYCSERLCAEDMMVFDSKINNENLTKCLQTLKELYADMENKRGTYCPNEAEFRAYMVLMNLNEGDTLREVQQLREHVRDSPEISFAMKAYATLNSNNYVRFFRLVKSASCLNACILHRYFNQIRARALQIILRAYTAGQKKVDFPLSELKRLLSFESEEDIREFYAYYGLSAVGSNLKLDRSAYIEPESTIPSWRAISLVESKRMVSVGELINGGRLQPVQLPVPQCSFDEQGRFIGNLEGLTDSGGSQERIKPFTVKAATSPPELLPSPLQRLDAGAAAAVTAAAPAAVAAADSTSTQHDTTAPAEQQQFVYSAEAIRMVARELFWEVIDETVRSSATELLDALRRILSLGRGINDDILGSVTSELTREVCVEIVDDAKQTRQQETAEREERATADVVAAVIEDVVDEQVLQIASEEIQDAKAKDHADRMERCISSLRSEVLQEVTDELSQQVADEVHEVDVVARLQLLYDMQKAVELKRTSQWLSIWRKALRIRQRQKRAMLDFPCAPPMQSASERLRNMFPDRPERTSPLVPGKAALLVNDRACVTLLSPFDAEQRSLMLTAHLSLASLVDDLRRSHAWQPLKLASVLRTPLTQGLQQWHRHLVKESSLLSVQWKLLLSLPGNMEMEEDEGGDGDLTEGNRQVDLLQVLKQWLCAKFTHGEGGGGGSAGETTQNVLSQYSIQLDGSASDLSKLRLGICVRNVPEFSRTGKGKQPTAEQGLSITKGTSAILFLLPHADTEDDNIWLAARLRLARLLEAKPLLPPTPLVLLSPCCPRSPCSSQTLTDSVTSRLGVEGFQDKGLLSDVAVVELPLKAGLPADVAVASLMLQNQLKEAVKFLASKVPEPPDLRCERLGDLVEDVLTQHFFTPVLQDLRLRQQQGKLHQAPNTMIGLYNCVLDHIAQALTSPALQDISWPAPELVGTSVRVEGVPKANWNSPKHQADIYELVANLRLPWFHYKDQSATDWGQVCQDVWTFVDAMVKKRCDSSVSLTTSISRLLARTCLEFENMCSLTQNEDYCIPTYVNAPWTDIVLACVDFRLQRLHNWKEEEEEVGGDLEVHYEEEDLTEFEPPASWLQALLDTEDMETHRVQDTIEQAAMTHYANRMTVEEDNFTGNNSNDSDSEMDQDDSSVDGDSSPSVKSHHSSRSLFTAAQGFEEVPDNMQSAMNESQSLLLNVGEERQKSQAFERFLEKALQGDTLLDMDASPILTTLQTPRHVLTPALSLTTPSGIRTSFNYRASVVPSTLREAGMSSRRLPFTPELSARQQASGSMHVGRETEVEGGTEAGRLCTENQPLSQRLEQLKDDLQSQRYANQLFEKRLQSYMES